MMKKALTFALPLLAVLVGAPTSSQASDHIDGLKTAIDNAADLTDVFTFTSPTNPDKLVLIMNVHGIAFSRSRFSNAVDYKFRIRPIDDARTLTPSPDPAREQSIVCSFSGGFLLVDARQRATCKFNFGSSSDSVSFETRTGDFKAGGSGEQNGIRVFAGVRSDPWFLDLARTLKFNNSIPVARTPGINGLQGQNVLSIVVEVDKRRLAGPLLAITAQTVRK
jgi:hypothetical protein